MTTRATTKPAEGADAKAEDSDVKGFIKFNGHNGVRVISKADWESIGIKDQDDASWDKTNGWRLPSEDFSKRALNYLLKVDGEFTSED